MTSTTTPATGGTPLRHGKLSTYTHQKCRCIPCTLTANAWDANRRRQLAYGRWKPYVAAAPVRTHVQALTDAGMTWAQIADAAHLNVAIVRNLLVGVSSRPPSRSIRVENAKALLSVRIPPRPPADGTALIDATGTIRRLRALVATGWPITAIARRAGIDSSHLHRLLHGAVREVAAGTAHTVHVLYDDLWDADPAAEGIRATSIRRAHQVAATYRWAPPLAWDDDTINDPSVVPDWTGRCGTTGGYYDHSQLGTPTCQPCRDAVNAAASERKTKRRARQAA